MFSKLQMHMIWIVSISLALTIAHPGSAQPLEWLTRHLRAKPTADGVGEQLGQSNAISAASTASTATHVDYDAYLSSRGQPPGIPAQLTTPQDVYPRHDLYAPGDLYAPQDVYAPEDVYGPPHAYRETGGATWQLLPEGLIYDTYLAGTQEPRLALHLMDINSNGCHFAGFLGARVPLLRYGTTNPIRPEGFQVDAEGLAHVRIDFADNWLVDAADFRGGLMTSYGHGKHRTKFGYYHLSSHLQDEFLESNPGYPRLNFSRDVLVLGHSYYLGERLRIYGEVGYAFISDVSQPWEFQFGLDYAPCGPTGIRGAPFFAINGHLREEVNFGGALTTQLGWAWVGDTGKMLRMGLHYYNGKSNEYSFYDDFERQIGFGIWYDF